MTRLRRHSLAVKVWMLLVWTAVSLALPVAAQKLAPAHDLRADGELAGRLGTPLIVLVSLDGCPHCEVVRRSHLLPLVRTASASPAPVIRQVELRGSGMLVDFGGEQKSHAAFARQHRVNIAPVVMFFDAKGRMLVPPLIGAMIPDFYGAYFDSALADARARMANADGAAPAKANP
jgi:thioredoxin-related protein